MATNDLDAIIALTNGPAWPTNEPGRGRPRRPLRVLRGLVVGRCGLGLRRHHGARRSFGTERGRDQPITRPSGSTATAPGLPIGITFIGGRWAEPELLGLAYDYEQATQVRVPPRFIPTIGDALFPGVPNPPDLAQAQRPQATQDQRDLVVRFW